MLALLEFPPRDLRNVPQALRALAEGIERGDYGDAHNVGWVVDCGGGKVECGLLGEAPQPGATAHLLFAVAQRKLESSATE